MLKEDFRNTNFVICALRFLVTVRDFSLLQRIQNESRAPPASASIDNLGALPNVKWRGVGSLSFTLTSVWYRGEEWVELNLHFRTCPEFPNFRNCICWSSFLMICRPSVNNNVNTNFGFSKYFVFECIQLQMKLTLITFCGTEIKITRLFKIPT